MSMTWSRRPSLALLLIGIFELILAGFFVILGIKLPVASSGMFLTAGILGLTGVGLLVWGRKSAATFAQAEELRATGLDALGQITGLRQTGVYLNQQPQVEITMQVQTEGRPPYPVTKKEYVPLMLVGRLSSGQPLPLKVSPSDPTAVVIDWTNSTIIGPPGAAGPGSAQGVIVGKDVAATPDLIAQGAAQGMLPQESEIEARRALLRANGADGSAVVQSVSDSGQTIGRYKVMIVDLVVNTDGNSRDVPACGAAVAPEAIEKVAPGMVVPIKYDPANPDDMTLLWEDARPAI